MKKILILTEFFPPNNSGVSLSVSRFVTLLRQKGHKNISVAAIEPLTEEYSYPQYRKEAVDGITVWHIYAGTGRPLTKAEDIRVCEYMVKDIIAQNLIDAIHAYGIFNAGYIAYRINQECNIPYILSVRGNDLTRKLYSYGEIYPQSLIIRKAQAITYVNGFLQNCLLQNFPEVSGKSYVVYNSIVPEKEWQNYRNQRSELKKRYQVQDKFVFTYIGEVKEKKQTMMLMDAFRRFNNRYPDTVLYIVGYVYHEDREMLDKLLKQCRDILYVPKVTHEEVGRFYAISDAFVQMSYDDGLPNALLEAIYMQVPIIASNIFSDFLTHGEDALLANPFSIQELSDSMLRLYSDPLLRERLAESASQLLSGKLSTENEYSSFTNIYDKIG